MVRTNYADAWTLDPTSRELLDAAGVSPSTRTTASQPERRLVLAVLEDAVSTFQKYVALRMGTPRHFRQVEAWLTSDDTAWGFSFVNVCDMLDLDVAQCRAGLARWRRRHEAGVGAGVTVGSRALRVGGPGHRLGAVGADRPGNGRPAVAPGYRENPGLRAR